MKIATLIVRLLVGLLLLFASVTYFLKVFPDPELTGNLKTFQDGLNASGYLMPLVKTVELLVGLSYLSNRWVVLANLVFLPVSVNILLVNTFLSPETLVLGAFVFLGNVWLIYQHWPRYQTLIQTK